MPIEFRCQSCSRILRTPDESAGKKAKCPECAAIVDIPATSTSESPGPTSGAPAWTPAPKHEPAPNPYSAPDMPFEDPNDADLAAGKSHLPPLTPTRISLDDFITRPWELIKSQVLMGVAVGMVAMGLASLSGAPGQVLNVVGALSRNVYLQVAGMALIYTTNLLVQSWIQLGMTKVGLHWARTGEVQIGELFSVSKLYLRGLGLLALMVVVFLTLLVGCFFPVVLAIFSREEALAVITGIGGILVYVSIATVVWIHLYFAFPLLVDRQVGVFDAIRLSTHYVSGNRLNLFLTGLVMGACSLLGVMCTCGIGVLMMPAVQAIFNTTAYLLATGQAVHRPMKKSATSPGNEGSPFIPGLGPLPEYAPNPAASSGVAPASDAGGPAATNVEATNSSPPPDQPAPDQTAPGESAPGDRT